jgi:hypothetical protein
MDRKGDETRLKQLRYNSSKAWLGGRSTREYRFPMILTLLLWFYPNHTIVAKEVEFLQQVH